MFQSNYIINSVSGVNLGRKAIHTNSCMTDLISYESYWINLLGEYIISCKTPI